MKKGWHWKKKKRKVMCYVLKNSTLKGQVGEECMLQELNQRFPRADIEDTHKSTGRGDFILKEGAFGMLIEIKNYTKNVPKHEIDKFYKDMNTNHDIQCGVLLSLQSGRLRQSRFPFGSNRRETDSLFTSYVPKYVSCRIGSSVVQINS